MVLSWILRAGSSLRSPAPTSLARRRPLTRGMALRARIPGHLVISEVDIFHAEAVALPQAKTGATRSRPAMRRCARPVQLGEEVTATHEWARWRSLYIWILTATLSNWSAATRRYDIRSAPESWAFARLYISRVQRPSPERPPLIRRALCR